MGPACTRHVIYSCLLPVHVIHLTQLYLLQVPVSQASCDEAVVDFLTTYWLEKIKAEPNVAPETVFIFVNCSVSEVSPITYINTTSGIVTLQQGPSRL